MKFPDSFTKPVKAIALETIVQWWARLFPCGCTLEADCPLCRTSRSILQFRLQARFQKMGITPKISGS